ncbi:hypothetical protein F4820DRAFT_412332 [Hypoxylon rubiginosum]|uniref:Uncharacterized protein n=1 Tax=Hypoxylon rubiginosum TaxID=110542 RepID=A0ACB9Z9J3_9PEZI|nr:hypothetical protein F4820DRAFT_412332 [Hypoxylon rubiginosum]
MNLTALVRLTRLAEWVVGLAFAFAAPGVVVAFLHSQYVKRTIITWIIHQKRYYPRTSTECSVYRLQYAGERIGILVKQRLHGDDGGW